MDPVAAVLIAMALPYVPHALKAVAAHRKLPKGYDLRDPRRATAEASASNDADARYISRCQGAHQNSLESWPQFAVAVLFAMAAGVDGGTLSRASTLYVAARVAYLYAYVTGATLGVASMRSLLWFVSVGACVWLMWAAITARGFGKLV